MKVVKTFIQDGKTAVKIISNAPVVPVTSFEFVQGVPSTEWVVQHNLDKFPAVTVLDSSGNEYEVDVFHIDKNTTRISFSVAFSGTAVFN